MTSNGDAHFAPLTFQARPIPELSWEETIEATARREPFVVRGGIADWELCTTLRSRATPRAKLAYLRRILGKSEVVFTAIPPDETYRALAEDGSSTPAAFHHESFDAFAARLETSFTDPSAVKPYLEAGDLSKMPAVTQRMDPLPHALPLHRQGLWIGPGGHIANLHYDGYTNTVCMIDGYKRVTLLPYDVMPDMYVAPVDWKLGGAESTRLRLLEADLERFPSFERARAHAVVSVLGPGDALRIPALWWHHIESAGLNVMVSQWCHDVALAARDAAEDEFRHAIWTLGGLPASVQDACRTWLRRHVFRVDDGGGTRGEQGDARALLDAFERAAGPRARRDVEQGAHVFDLLPPHWLRFYAIKYDLLVFKRHGEPFPGLPGEFEAMSRRLAAAEGPWGRFDRGSRIYRATARVNERLAHARHWAEKRVTDARAAVRKMGA